LKRHLAVQLNFVIAGFLLVNHAVDIDALDRVEQ
jgi:hypothetical protein